ncbi:MAG: NUDIX hydrolase [Planctomycetes bacterium]|nr:NUDIX hydrolase [Planctomycetota bacterium]
MSEAEQRILGSGNHLRLVSRAGWEFVERIGATGVVAILAVTEDDRIVLTEQFRPAVNAFVLDLPAGLAGDVAGAETEPLVEAATRELEEETGYRAERFRVLATGPSSAGLTSEMITLFEATGLEKVGEGGGDASEQIEVHEVPLSEIRSWLWEQSRVGRLVDPKIYAALYLAALD